MGDETPADALVGDVIAMFNANLEVVRKAGDELPPLAEIVAAREGLREAVGILADLGFDVIPQVDMPGPSELVTAAYYHMGQGRDGAAVACSQLAQTLLISGMPMKAVDRSEAEDLVEELFGHAAEAESRGRNPGLTKIMNRCREFWKEHGMEVE